MTSKRTLRIGRGPLRALRPAPDNAKAHDIPAIIQSLRRFGFVTPVVLDEASDELLAGHGRVEALAQMRDAGDDPPEGVLAKGGDWHIPVVRGVSLDGDASAYRVADNRTVELGGWDDAQLASVLEDLAAEDALLGTGYDDGDLAKLLTELGEPTSGETDPDATPPVPVKARSTLGEVYELGPHRVMCGDALTEAWPESAAVAVTDPPYAIMGSSTGFAHDMSIVRAFFQAMWRTFARCSVRDAHICCDWRTLPEIMATAAPYAVRAVIVWDKGGGGLGNPYMRRHEFLAYAAVMPEAGHGRRRPRRARSITDSDVWAISRDTENLHGAGKPVELMRRAIANGSTTDETVLDPFLGSGSTLIAAEQLGRVCYGIEIEPRYVDVVRQRYADFVGDQQWAP